jgi:hypothetical protein
MPFKILGVVALVWGCLFLRRIVSSEPTSAL